jgi:hypothetical protein
MKLIYYIFSIIMAIFAALFYYRTDEPILYVAFLTYSGILLIVSKLQEIVDKLPPLRPR